MTPDPVSRLAIVVQRYGPDIGGGAELHARYIAERLARHADVRVLTTCARDYLTWRNELPPGEQRVNGIPVERFPVACERDLTVFARRSSVVFEQTHSIADELAWLESEGPSSPALLARLERTREAFDFVLLFSARYHHAYHAARLVPDRAVLVPTAEREPSVGLAIFGPIFRGVRAVMYNSPEERALIRHVSQNAHVPGVVVGVGSEIPPSVDPEGARRRFGLDRPFLIYIGRIDANKGCAELFDHFRRYVDRTGRNLDLVLIGTPLLPVPHHPHVRHLGPLPDADKFDVLAAAAALVMPSYYESLSMAALEAWALGRPVVANARCDVLLGQCRRSNAGLYYRDRREFEAVLDRLLDDAALASRLGENGRTFYQQQYAWPAIEQKYLEMFDRLRTAPPAHRMEPMPGWLACRSRRIPPAAAIVGSAPRGAVLEPR